jgi:hypothetical protein
MLLGVALLIFLALAYVENMVFFRSSKDLFANPHLTMRAMAVVVVFIHNVLVVSLILLAMTFYVELVLSFFKPRKYEYVVLQHPRVFAFVFTLMIVLLSIFRASTIALGGVIINALATIILLSLPSGIIEAYGIYLTIQKTLKRTMTLTDLLTIYLLLLIAAVVEVGFIHLLMISSA